MRRQAVESRAVNSIGYESMTLEVEFRDGRVYQYFPVPEITFRELMSADSIGNFVATRIKPYFQVRRG
jgi:KTSC domain